MELAVQRYLEMGRFAIAAKHVTSLAEMYETQVVDLDKAIKYYEQVCCLTRSFLLFLNFSLPLVLPLGCDKRAVT